jgi:hypothetical protein
VTSNLDYKISSDGEQKVSGNQALTQDVANNKRDIDKFGVDLAQLLIDYNAFKASASRNILDTGSTLEMERMLNRISQDDLHYRVSDLQKASAQTDTLFKENFQKFLKDAPAGGNPELDELRKRQMDEKLDGKIQRALETLKSDNLYIWKQSLELAQREFTEKGVGQTMNMLPKTILDRADLKRTVNSLIMEEGAQPKPQVVGGKAQVQLSPQKSDNSKAATEKRSEPAESVKANPPPPQKKEVEEQKQMPPPKAESGLSGASAQGKAPVEAENLASEGNKSAGGTKPPAKSPVK